MSYIEKKYKDKIAEVFLEITELEKKLVETLSKQSLKEADNIGKLCAGCNKHINIILKKYYPEIVQISDKLEIKSRLMFYYDLIDKLSTLIRAFENFQKVDPAYYEKIVEFINDKEVLVAGKYKAISTQELTAFYDPQSRKHLEQILMQKLATKEREFFTFGSLEQEIKKIAKVVGATGVRIRSISSLDESDREEAKNSVSSPQSIVKFEVDLEEKRVRELLSNKDFKSLKKLDAETKDKLIQIYNELKKYLESKQHEVVLQNPDYNWDDILVGTESVISILKELLKLLPKLFESENNVDEKALERMIALSKKVLENPEEWELQYANAIITDVKLLPD